MMNKEQLGFYSSLIIPPSSLLLSSFLAFAYQFRQQCASLKHQCKWKPLPSGMPLKVNP
jgi:hypothetical protein